MYSENMRKLLGIPVVVGERPRRPARGELSLLDFLYLEL
jgi:hypothetical protein